MVKLRKDHPVLVYGKYSLLDKANPKVYAYTRTLENEKLLVIFNWSKTPVSWKLPAGITLKGQPLINNYTAAAINKNVIMLKPYQAIVLGMQ